MRNFLWEHNSGSKTSHLVNWQLVMASKERGGIGILNLRLMNQALLAKWRWRFGLEKSHLWYKLIEEKYGSNFSVWTPGAVNTPNGVSCWRNIAEAGALVTANSTLTVHSGSKISFWHDQWKGDSCLMLLFKSLYKLDGLKNASISEHITATGSWKFDFKRNFTTTEIDTLAALMVYIGSTPPILDALPDVRRWSLHPTGIFSVKSLYAKMICEDGIDNFPHQFIWVNEVPPKINFLLWCAVHGKLNLQDMLQHKGKDIYSCCSLCGNSRETQDHILIHCKVAQKIWSSITPSDNWAWFFPETMLNLENTWDYNTLSSNGRKIWRLIPAAVTWVLWKERNCRIFEEKYCFKTDEQLCSDAKSLVFTWVACSGSRYHLNQSYTLHNWNIVFA